MRPGTTTYLWQILTEIKFLAQSYESLCCFGATCTKSSGGQAPLYKIRDSKYLGTFSCLPSHMQLQWELVPTNTCLFCASSKPQHIYLSVPSKWSSCEETEGYQYVWFPSKFLIWGKLYFQATKVPYKKSAAEGKDTPLPKITFIKSKSDTKCAQQRNVKYILGENRYTILLKTYNMHYLRCSPPNYQGVSGRKPPLKTLN